MPLSKVVNVQEYPLFFRPVKKTVTFFEDPTGRFLRSKEFPRGKAWRKVKESRHAGEGINTAALLERYESIRNPNAANSGGDLPQSKTWRKDARRACGE